MSAHEFRQIWPFIAAMIFVITLSNVAVGYPFRPFGLGQVLTWGAFTFPLVFLVSDLANRAFGATAARRIVAYSFPITFLASWAATGSLRIAFASLSAWLIAQFMDIAMFDRLRRAVWWQAPLFSSMLASVFDTSIFFSLAFAGSVGQGVYFGGTLTAPLWIGWASGDLLVKFLAALLLLAPYRLALARLPRR